MEKKLQNYQMISNVIKVSKKKKELSKKKLFFKKESTHLFGRETRPRMDLDLLEVEEARALKYEDSHSTLAVEVVLQTSAVEMCVNQQEQAVELALVLMCLLLVIIVVPSCCCKISPIILLFIVVLIFKKTFNRRNFCANFNLFGKIRKELIFFFTFPSSENCWRIK